MKTRWLQLSIREQQYVAGGALLIALGLVYAIIFAPLTSANDHLRKKITSSEVLLNWMQISHQRILTLEKIPPHKAASSSLLSLLQTNISTQTFNKQITTLQQAENDSVQLHLQKVSFDAIMQWLLELNKTQGVVIAALTTQANGTPGIVDMDLTLQAGK